MPIETIPLMAHLVAGYPDSSASLAAARGLAEGGASFLEVQIPFSDPSADGPSIRDACSAALEAGSSAAAAFSLVARLRAEFPALPIFVMAYANLAAAPGPEAFAARAREAGADGLIVPDLPFDDDEGLAAACAAAGPTLRGGTLCAVPVAAPTMRPERLRAMAALGRPWLYAALRAGITGAETAVDGATLDFLREAGAGGSRVMAGFGVRSGGQARALAPRVDAVVAGSVFVDAIRAAAAGLPPGPERDAAVRAACREAAREIAGGGAGRRIGSTSAPGPVQARFQ